MVFVKFVLDSISPDLRKLIVDFVRSLSPLAQDPPIPLDSVLIDFLKRLLDIKD